MTINLTDMFKKTWTYLVIALIITFVLRYKFGAEFFDLFGLIIFGGLIFVGIYGLAKQKKLPNFILISLVVVGIFGILIDGFTSFQIIKSWIFG